VRVVARSRADGASRSARSTVIPSVNDDANPPSTVYYSPSVRSIQTTNPDALYVASYPPYTCCMARAITEIGLNVKLCCGGMVGLQSAALKTQLGPLLNGMVNYDFWLPAPTMQFPGMMDLLKKYQAKASAEGVDALGYYMPPYAYAYLQVLGEAVEATKGLDQDKLAAYMHEHTFKTVAGDIKFGENGEWAEARVLQVQFQGIKGNDVEQFKNPETQVIVAPQQQTRAASIGQATFALSIIIGPAIASPLYFLVGPFVACSINAASFLVSALCLMAVRASRKELRPYTQSEKSGIGAVVSEVYAGLRLIMKSRVLSMVMILALIAFLGVGALTALDIIFVVQRLHVSASLYGPLTAVSGLGTLIGAIVIGIFANRFKPSWLLSGCVLLLGTGIIIYAFQTWYVLALVIIFLSCLPQGGIDIGFAPLIIQALSLLHL